MFLQHVCTTTLYYFVSCIHCCVYALGNANQLCNTAKLRRTVWGLNNCHVLQGCNASTSGESGPTRATEAAEITSQSASHHPLPHQKEFPVSHKVSSIPPPTPTPSHTHQLTDSSQRRRQDDGKHKC